MKLISFMIIYDCVDPSMSFITIFYVIYYSPNFHSNRTLERLCLNLRRV